MKRMKRLVALLVALATIASLCVVSIPVYAEDAATAPAVTVSDEDLLRIEKLEALGVIDVKYDPADYVTRSEMADIIIKYMNITASANTEGTPFRDVSMKDSSFASICTLYNMGIISGDDQLRFNPDNHVTYDEALVFITNAIGYKMFAVREGGYPTGYHRVAIKLGMLKGLTMQKGTDPVSFPDLYKMLEAALDAAAVVPEYYGDGSTNYTLSDTDTYLYVTYGIRKYPGTVSGNEYTKLTSANSSLTDEQIEIDGKYVFDTPGYVYGYFLGYSVNYYAKVNSTTDAEMIYIEEAKNVNTLTRVDAEDILEKSGDYRLYYEDENYDEHHIDFEQNYKVIYNNQVWLGHGTLKNAIPDRGYVELLDNDGNSEIDIIFVYEYENYVVEGVDSYYETIKDKCTGETIDLDTHDNEITIHYTGETKKRNFNAISVDSVISVIASKGDVKTVYVNTETVAGKITGSNSDEGYLIGETYYKVADNYDAVIDKERVFPKLEVGLEGTFYLDMNGEIAAYKKEVTVSENEKFGMLIALQNDSKTYSTDLKVKIYTQDGEFLTAKIAENVKINGEKFKNTEAEEADIIELKLTADDVYLVQYTLSNSGEIVSINTLAYGQFAEDNGDYTIDVLTENLDGNSPYIKSAFTTRAGRMVIADGDGDQTVSGTQASGGFYNESGTRSLVRRFSESGVIFIVPDKANKNNEEMYDIYDGKFQGDRIWGYETRAGAYNDNVVAPSFSAYSLGLSDIPMIDLFVFMVDSVSATEPDLGSELAIISSTGVGSNADDQEVAILYLNEGDSFKLAKDVAFYNSTYTDGKKDGELFDSKTLTTGSDPLLAPGVVILYNTNMYGEIDSIKAVTEYNGKEAVLLSKLNNSTNSYWYSIGTKEENLIVGKVLRADNKEKLLQVEVTTGETKSDSLLITGGTVYTYYANGQKLVSSRASDLGGDEWFIAKVDDYFAIKQMYVFK